MSVPIFVYRPAVAEEIALLISIPHAGTFVPPDVAAGFLDPALPSIAMVDWHVDALYSFAPELGVDVVHATHHRFVIDLNRPSDAMPLYPGRFETGLVPVETFQGERIWREPPAQTEIARRLEEFHEPYHAALEARLREKVAAFGRCYLIDAHSVESRANRLHGALEHDVYLGNRDGQTCDAEFIELVRTTFVANGLRVSINQPYKGGYTTAHYPKVAGVQTLQIEMCQRLYMKEGQPEGARAAPEFTRFQARLLRVLEAVADAIRAPQLKC